MTGSADENLQIGFSAGEPLRVNGGMLATWDGITFTTVYSPSEQGLQDFHVDADSGKIYVSGSDPCCPDGGDLGNMYVWDVAGASVTKHRNMPLVIHGLGAWLDDGVLYAVGSQVGVGVVLTSTDSAATWGDVVGDPSGIRFNDIIGNAAGLYATSWTQFGQQLKRSTDNGATWAEVAGVVPMGSGWTSTRMVVLGDSIIGIDHDYLRLFEIDGAGDVTYHDGPCLMKEIWNAMDVDGGYLYLLTSLGVWRSADLSDWELLCEVTDGISLAAWPADGSVMVATGGTDAALYRCEMP